VRVLIIRGNAAEPHEVTLERAKPSTTVVSGQVSSSDNVGIVRVQSFSAAGKGGVAESLRSQAASMQKAGAKAMVIDLRGVADGSYEDAIKAAEVFVGSGTIATRAGRDASNKEQIASTSGASAVTIPVVILQSFGTSGPAEVFIAALAGNKRAEIVGERTAGLAAEQRLVRLPENYGLWMTYRRYYTIGQGDAVQPSLERGLKPDVNAEDPNVEFGEPAPTVDTMLAKAIERAKAL
jgi:carboxyl-terminal processing protease